MDEALEVRTDGNSLLKAVYLCRLRLTRLLIEGGAYINESNDRGETPLMIACKTRYADQQSVSKVKMVKFLLENKADPNIQDKSGKTALMHACLEKAGSEVVSYLLKSGADPSLEDHFGCSALLYAIKSDDKESLKVLLDACKAKGKEVIIITMDKSPSGRQTTKQYLNVPPTPNLEDQHSSFFCASPSEVELKTSSSLVEAKEMSKNIFSFKEPCHQLNSKGSSQPGSPSRKPNQVHVDDKLPHLHRLNSEPWLKIPPSLLHQNKACSFHEELQCITPEEEDEMSFKINGLALHKRYITRHQSIDVKDSIGLLKTLEQSSDNSGPRKLSYDEAHSNLLCPESGHSSCTVPVDQEPDSIHMLGISSLRNIVQRRNVGAEHYNSDSQLTVQPSQISTEDSKSLLEKKKRLSNASSLLSISRESLENITSGCLSRRHPSILERRGSGALLLDHISQARPGFLPPLNVNPHPPIPDITINKSGCTVSSGPKSFIPTAPNFPKDVTSKKMLLRRHSMHAEQIKHLTNFEELFGQ
ncbi:ankyrin repeat domain-containing protein 34B [Protopterus annectens]|uniref:ankyrin repeat domain-containing protein 34B n=1 Tax=Protopterus annectens TaxID=7888 RepID=UPI001CF999B7|nr:ankyrin repeat domain-containing protein 34B [Protopterus annectens]